MPWFETTINVRAGKRPFRRRWEQDGACQFLSQQEWKLSLVFVACFTESIAGHKIVFPWLKHKCIITRLLAEPLLALQDPECGMFLNQFRPFCATKHYVNKQLCYYAVFEVFGFYQCCQAQSCLRSYFLLYKPQKFFAMLTRDHNLILSTTSWIQFTP